MRNSSLHSALRATIRTFGATIRLRLLIAPAVLLMASLLTGCATQKLHIGDSPSCVVLEKDTVKTSRLDSVMVHDSIYVHEYARGDTVYIDRIRDRWRDRLIQQRDTIYQTSTTTSTSTVRYVPRFYKWCTGLFWGAVVLALIAIALRIAKAIYLRK